MITFPQEIFDYIVDFLHDDTVALAACSLVCKTWVPSSRYHLFSEIPVQLVPTDDATRFLQLLANPDSDGIAPFIRKVKVLSFDTEASLEEMDFFYKALTILRDATPGYSSIFLLNLPLQLEKLTKVLPLGRLTELTAEDCKVDNFYDLLTLFSAMPNLQRLTLDDVRGPLKLEHPINATLLLPQLHSLQLPFCYVQPILKLLAPPPKLRKVDFKIQMRSDVLCVASFLCSLGPDLKKVTLHCGVCDLDEWFIQTIGLRNMTGIRSLNLDIYTVSSRVWECIPSVIDSITSCAIDHITFRFDCRLDKGLLRHDHWVSIPVIMERPNFRHLRKLEFRLFVLGPETEEVERWILLQLRDLGPRGILQISTY